MAKPKVRNIINILTNRPSLESEFAVESAIKELSTVKNIDELRELASQLARVNHIQFYERKFKKKAPLMKRLKYILFGKD